MCRAQLDVFLVLCSFISYQKFVARFVCRTRTFGAARLGVSPLLHALHLSDKVIMSRCAVIQRMCTPTWSGSTRLRAGSTRWDQRTSHRVAITNLQYVHYRETTYHNIVFSDDNMHKKVIVAQKGKPLTGVQCPELYNHQGIFLYSVRSIYKHTRPKNNLLTAEDCASQNNITGGNLRGTVYPVRLLLRMYTTWQLTAEHHSRSRYGRHAWSGGAGGRSPMAASDQCTEGRARFRPLIHKQLKMHVPPKKMEQ